MVIAGPEIESKIKKYEYEDFLDGLSSTTAPRYPSEGGGCDVLLIAIVGTSGKMVWSYLVTNV